MEFERSDREDVGPRRGSLSGGKGEVVEVWRKEDVKIRDIDNPFVNLVVRCCI